MARKKKETTVDLVVKGTNTRKSFGILHAERLLDMGPECNGGWEIAPDSEFYYDEENGIRLKTDNGNDTDAV